MDVELYRPGLKGCTDGNCLLVKNTGMVTNGGCQCEADIRRAPHGFDAIRTIGFLRAQLIESATEVRRLREREAKARELLQAHVAEYVRTDTDEGVARAAERVAIWMDAARWLAEGE